MGTQSQRAPAVPPAAGAGNEQRDVRTVPGARDNPHVGAERGSCPQRASSAGLRCQHLATHRMGRVSVTSGYLIGH